MKNEWAKLVAFEKLAFELLDIKPNPYEISKAKFEALNKILSDCMKN